jgi:creatinine amidohydrolase
VNVAARNFCDLTFREIEALPADVVAVLPLGAIEQHGPHLPVSTDYVIASAVAEAAVISVVETGTADVVLMPALPYTKSDEHHWAPGTIWLSWETLMRTLVDIGRSLAVTPIERVLFVNGHGGNSALGQVACRQLRREFGLKTFLAHPFVPVDHGGTDVGDPGELGLGVHGGFKETSMMLHLRPDLVHLDLAERAVPEKLAEYSMIGFGKPVSFGWLSNDFGPAGHIGDPTGANAEAGKALFEAAVGAMAAVVEEASRFAISS